MICLLPAVPRTGAKAKSRGSDRPVAVTCDGCALHADAAQAGELLDHLAGPVQSIGRRNLIPFTLKLCNLRKYELQPSEQTLNFGQCIRWIGLSRPVRSSASRRRRL
jgi:hypothetical protein